MSREEYTNFLSSLTKGKKKSPRTPEHVANHLASYKKNRALGIPIKVKPLTDEQKKKRSEALKKYHREHPVSEETRAKLSKIHKGKPVSEERKRKQSLAMMGHSVSEETRRKISLAKLGKKRIFSESHLENLRAACDRSRFKLKQAWTPERKAAVTERYRLRAERLKEQRHNALRILNETLA